MRQLSVALKELLATGEAIEPIMIIGISWSEAGEIFYADRHIGDPLNPVIRGQILEFGELETITRLDGNGQATSISFTLDDTDGQIKGFIDNTDLLFKRVNIYQHFNDLSTGDLVSLFNGELVTPIEWDEATRSVNLTAITRQSTNEVGFALSESNTPIFHQSLLNEPWPLIFGSARYVKTLPLQEVPTGTIRDGFGTPDQSAENKIKDLNDQLSANAGMDPNAYFVAEQSEYNPETGLYSSSDEDFEAAYSAAAAYNQALNNQASAIRTEIENIEGQSEFVKFKPTNYVIGGYRFPQGVPLICKINEELFIVRFLGGKEIPDNPEQPCKVSVALYKVPLAYRRNAPLEGPGFHQAGSKIELISHHPDSYRFVASVTPGIVTAIYAYRTFNGTKSLTRVPTRYYTTVKETLANGLEATYVVLPRMLSTLSYFDNWATVQYDDLQSIYAKNLPQYRISKIRNEVDWEDDIYVDFTSTIGPNVIDIMKWVITNYTNYTWDITSFEHVSSRVDPYPAHFSLTNRPTADSFLNDLAYQSRCAIWLKSGVYYVKYLPEKYATTSTLTDDSIEADSLKVFSSSTDELITKYIANWRQDGIRPTNSVVLKHNVHKYGIVEQSYDYYIYNNLDLVMKSATFWLIRKSNIWKMVQCNVLLDKLEVETMDDILLDLNRPFVSNESINCQVENCQYDSATNIIAMTLWTGIRFGEMEPYVFARPADISENLIFPLFNDVVIGARPVPAPKVPAYNNIQKNASSGGSGGSPTSPNVDKNEYIKTDRPLSFGDKSPSDINDQHTPLTQSSVTYNYIDPITPYIDKPIPDVNAPASVPTEAGSTVYPGIVQSGSGTTWSVEIYKKSIGSTTTVSAIELHGASNLKGLDGDCVTVFEMKDGEGNKSYYFYSDNYAAFRATMSDNTSGTIRPHGTNIAESITQMQIAASATIPSGTMGIAVRTFNGGTAVYSIQIPVWLSPF